MEISNVKFAGNYEIKKLISKWSRGQSGANTESAPLMSYYDAPELSHAPDANALTGAGHAGFDRSAHTKAELENQAKTAARFPHCILIEGEQGTGKRLLASIIAQAALCTHPDGLCGECANCKKAIAKAHPDIEIYGGNDKQSDYAVDIVRGIKNSAYVLPNEARYRIIILQNAHNMSEYAQNALLKIIEEPPEHLIFIMTARSDKRMLPTVLSRCTRIMTSPVSKSDAVQWLSAHYPDMSREMIANAAADCAGILGKAVEILSGALSEPSDLAQQMLEALVLNDELLLVRICGRFEKDRQLLNETLARLAVLLRDALAMSVKSDIAIGTSRELCQKAARSLRRQSITKLLDEIRHIRDYNNGYMNMNLLLSVCSSRMISAVRA